MSRFNSVLVIAALVLMPVLLAPAKANLGSRSAVAQAATFPAEPVVYWSNEARRAIVPAGPGGIFGAENYGNKFPGEAAVYMGIFHIAIYDYAVSI